jgi:hypothetical protein
VALGHCLTGRSISGQVLDDAVILGFATVDGLHVKPMPQDKVDAMLFTQFRDPVSAVHAFSANHKVISKGFEQCQ